MDDKVQIFFIYADDCEHCQQAFSTIEAAVELMKVQGIECEILKFHFDTKVAINIASKNGIDDLPGFVVGTPAISKYGNAASV